MDNFENTRQTNYTIAEGFELPSKGLIYDTKVNPHIELKSMTTRQELRRLSPSTTPLKVIADIIEECCIEKPAIHVYDMAIGDYEYLLHKLRIVTYGPDYKMMARCPKCGEVFEATANLEELELIDFDLEKFKELLTITLPKSGNTVTLKFQTPRMLDENEGKVKELKRKFKDADISFSVMTLLTSVIDTVNGAHLDREKLETFINNLPAMDMTKIINTVDQINALIGLDNKLLLTCPGCGGEVWATFRFGPEFFRPTNI